jgi:hypothetical protein
MFNEVAQDYYVSLKLGTAYQCVLAALEKLPESQNAADLAIIAEKLRNIGANYHHD